MNNIILQASCEGEWGVSFLLPVNVLKISPPVKAPYSVEGIGLEVSGQAPLSQPI